MIYYRETYDLMIFLLFSNFFTIVENFAKLDKIKKEFESDIIKKNDEIELGNALENMYNELYDATEVRWAQKLKDIPRIKKRMI